MTHAWQLVRRRVLALMLVAAALGSLGAAATARAVTITESTSTMTAGSEPSQIALGPDANMWYVDSAGSRIGRITPSGSVTEFQTPTADSLPVGIVAGPDGNLWFTELTPGAVGKVTPAGVITETHLGNLQPEGGIAVGPDHDIWITAAVHVDDDTDVPAIVRITTQGVATTFTSGLSAGAIPIGITRGPDANMWFTTVNDRIGRITPAGVITLFSTGITSGGLPFDIVTGPDDNLWFVEYSGSRIGRITTTGVVTEFSAIDKRSQPTAIVIGPDGNLWFTESVTHGIGRITTSGVITEYTAGIGLDSRPSGIASARIHRSGGWACGNRGPGPFGRRVAARESSA